MVEMAMGQQEMGAASDGGLVLIGGQDRVAGQPWIDQQDLPADFDAE